MVRCAVFITEGVSKTVKYNALHFPTYTFDQQFHIKALVIVTATSKYTKTSLPALFIRKKFTYLYIGTNNDNVISVPFIGQCIQSTSFRQTKYHAVYELTF